VSAHLQANVPYCARLVRSQMDEVHSAELAVVVDCAAAGAEHSVVLGPVACFAMDAERSAVFVPAGSQEVAEHSAGHVPAG
jgi:hypothetical protein